jgi:type IV secretory pathway TrbF-like protein
MTPTEIPLPPAGYEYGEARRRYVEQYGSTLVMNTYLQIGLACLSAVVVALVVLNIHTQRTFRDVKPLVIRIDDVGHAAAVSYDSLTYTPQAPELKYFLVQFVTSHYARMRATVRRHQAAVQSEEDDGVSRLRGVRTIADGGGETES